MVEQFDIGREATASSPLLDESGGFALPTELYVIPDGDYFLLYAPAARALALVNAETLRPLQLLRRTGTVALPPAQLHELLATGILTRRSPEGCHVRLPAREGPFDPTGVSLFLTTNCTMACTYCYADGGSRSRTMSWQTAGAAIDWICTHTLNAGRREFYVVFHGGGDVGAARSLLQRCVAHTRSKAAEHGLKARIDAGINGLLGETMVDWIIANLDGVTVSLDGLPAVHNAQRPLVGGGDSFDRVAATLRRMDECKYGYGVRMTVTAASLAKLPDSAEFIASEFSTSVIHAEPVFTSGRARFAQPVDPNEFVSRFREARVRVRRRGKDLRYSGARFDQLHNHFCKASNDSFVVTTDGHLSSCFEIGEPDDPRADLFMFGRMDPRTASPVVNDEKLRRLRSLTVENKPYCSDCFCRWHCAGDCAAKLAQDGDPWSPVGNPRCHINRELTKDLMKERLGIALAGGAA